MQRAVTPEDLTLLICIPLTKQQFDKQLRENHRFDYVASIARRYTGLSEEGLWNVLSSTAQTCSATVRHVESLGVRVIREAREDDLRHELRASRVVTVVAHWRHTPLDTADIQDLRSLFEEIELGTDWVCQTIRAQLAGAEERASPSSMLQILVDAIKTCTVAAETSNLHLDSLDLTRPNRADLELRFPRYITASPSIELADGLISVPQFLSSIPQTFEGVLDLTVCNSVILGSSVKRACPRITVVMNKQKASVRNRLFIYRAVANELSKRPQLYGDAVANIRRAIGELTP